MSTEDETSTTGLTRREVIQWMNGGLLAIGAGATLVSGRGVVETPTATAPSRMGSRKVREIENVWIPMRDGTKIAARLWLPEDTEQTPGPAIFNYIPYRKRDTTRLEDESLFRFYASHGYAGVRSDIRGSGDSEGLPMDEYEPQEQEDGLEIIEWIARQPWCTGKVGMFGISWGGFNSLQLAARQPPALKAIITHCSTDDRFTDDAHYSGGTINECMFVWGSMHTVNGPRPPDPEIVGSRWREMWRERLENLDFYVGDWLTHQHRDAFWKHASVNENWSAIQCPVYAVGGWADPYSSTISRMLENLRVPRKGLMGPWAHHYPYACHPGAPGPAIDWMNESLRWWNHWLKGTDTGIMKEPMFRVWMQDEAAFQHMTEIPGRWVAEDVWPSPRIRKAQYYLSDAGLESRAGPETTQKLAPLQTVGITAPYWYFTLPMDLPGDQRVDDARSLLFDSPVLDQPLEILGAPVAFIELAVDKPVAFLMLRLNELTSDGVSRRVTYGVLNLCHRNGHEFPRPLEPGKRLRIRLQIRDCAHVFKPGSRIRLAVSTTSWPMIWPSPEPVNLTLYTGASTLELPVRPRRAEDATLAPFGTAFVPENSGSTPLVEGDARTKQFEWDAGSGTLTIRTEQPYSRSRLNATGTEEYSSWREISQIRDSDPTSATLEHHRMHGYYRPGWDVRVETVLRMSVTQDALMLTGEFKAFDAGKQFFARKWERPIRRSLI
ncbi:MAG: CocE/NonD family hydrolase [Steroidobacteraceae bacterium]